MPVETAGPYPASISGYQYINPLTDAYSYMSLLLFRNTKGSAAQAITQTLARWQNETKRMALRLQTDGTCQLSKGYAKRSVTSKAQELRVFLQTKPH